MRIQQFLTQNLGKFLANRQNQSDNVTPERTANYEAFNHVYWQQPRDLPPFSFWAIHAMLFEPELKRALAVRAAPLHGVEFAYKIPDNTPRGFSWKPGVQCERADVADFIVRQLEKIRANMHHLVTAQIWGWSAGEVTLKLTSNNQVEINKFHPRRAEDCRVRIRRGKKVGIEVRNVQGEGVCNLDFPRAYFHNHDAQAGNHYGQSVLLGSYSPWADKWLNGGALDVRRLFMHKDAYGGVDLGYPGGETYVDAEKNMVPNRDIARQIVDQIKAGGTTVRPSERDANGNEMWPLTRATVPSNPQHILQYPKDLDAEMRTGVGVTDGVIDDDNPSGLGDTRSVAMQAFYSTLDTWMIELIADMVEQLIDHLVILNFGELVDYQVTHKPFAEQAMEYQNATQAQNSEGFDDGQSGGDGPDDDSDPEPGPVQDLSPVQDRLQRMSLQLIGEGVLSAADMVEAAGEVVRLAIKPKSGDRWITIGADKENNKKGYPVLIGADGRMKTGQFAGKTFDEAFADDDLREKYRDAEDSEKDLDSYYDSRFPDRETTDDDAPGISRSKRRVVLYQAESWGMSPQDYQDIADEVWDDIEETYNVRERAKTYARNQLGVDAGTIRRLENSGYDSGGSKIKGLDELGREMASIYPGLGWGEGYDDSSNSIDYGAELWDLLREGKQKKLSQVSAEFHEMVDERIHEMSQVYGLPSDWNSPANRSGQTVAMAIAMALRPGVTKSKNGKLFILNRNHRWELHESRQPTKRRQGSLFEKGKGDDKAQQSLFDDVDQADNKLFENESVQDAKARSKDNKYFRASKTELEEMANGGDKQAQSELDRRSAKRDAVAVGKRKVRVKTIRQLMDDAESGDSESAERLKTVDNPNLSDADRDRLAAILGEDETSAEPQPDNDADPKPEGPKDGDRNEDGLVFRNGRWHREDQDETDQDSESDIEPAEPEPSQSSEPAETDASQEESFDASIDAGATPREAATISQPREDDPEYQYARQSDVRNAGEDLLDSARHKVNAWKGLLEAEKDGTAEKLVTRDNLLKLEPHSIADHVESNPEVALVMYFAMRSFPAKPKKYRLSRATPEQRREAFVEAYNSVKQKAEDLAANETDVQKAIQQMHNHVAGLINEYRGSDKRSTHFDTSNDLIDLYRKTYKSGKTSMFGRFNEFKFNLKDGDPVEPATAIIQGKSINAAFGKKSKARDRFKPSEVYVQVAKREGGPDIKEITADPNTATAHLVDKVGVRGVQWGNSVTDDERKHHAARLVEAITDLADVTGLGAEEMSLGGKLGIAIGARGRGGAVAHYEPDSKVINLTRASGVGSLAHEWAHGFDHYLAGFGYKFGSQWGSKVSGEMRSAFSQLKSAGADYRNRLELKLSKNPFLKREYWASEVEIFARTFERFVQTKLESEGRKNTYLAGYEGKAHKFGGLWPTDEEIQQMAPAFESLLKAYRKERYGSENPVKLSLDDLFRYLTGGKDA